MKKYGIEPFMTPFYIPGYKEELKEYKDYCAKIDLIRNMPRLRKEVTELTDFRRNIRNFFRRVRVKVNKVGISPMSSFLILFIAGVFVFFVVFIIKQNI